MKYLIDLLALAVVTLLLVGGFTTAGASGMPIESRVEAELVNRIVAQWPWRADQIQVSELVLPEDLRLAPAARLEVRLPAARQPLGRLPFQLVVQTAEGEFRVWASARVEIMLEVLVSRRPLMRHQLIHPDDLGTARMPLSKASQDRLLPTDSVRQYRAAVRIPAGRTITRRMVEQVPVIRRGDRVTLLAKAPGLVVTAQGEARQDGAPDAAILVLNLTSRRMVQGRVLDAGTVEVAF